MLIVNLLIKFALMKSKGFLVLAKLLSFNNPAQLLKLLKSAPDEVIKRISALTPSVKAQFTGIINTFTGVTKKGKDAVSVMLGDLTRDQRKTLGLVLDQTTKQEAENVPLSSS